MPLSISGAIRKNNETKLAPTFVVVTTKLILWQHICGAVSEGRVFLVPLSNTYQLWM